MPKGQGGVVTWQTLRQAPLEPVRLQQPDNLFSKQAILKHSTAQPHMIDAGLLAYRLRLHDCATYSCAVPYFIIEAVACQLLNEIKCGSMNTDSAA